MTGLEIENFYFLDKKEYELKSNNEIIDLYQYSSKIINLEQMTCLMNILVAFFEFKLPNIIFYESSQTSDFNKTIEISKKLDINQLKYRLDHDYNMFLEISLGRTIQLRKETSNILESKMTFLQIENDGTIKNNELEMLKNFNYIYDIEKIKNMYDLYHYLETLSNKVDYSELEETIIKHKYDILLRNKFLELTMLKILYSENSLPNYSKERVKSFVRMINKEYDSHLQLDKIESIMNIDYSSVEKSKTYVKK